MWISTFFPSVWQQACKTRSQEIKTPNFKQNSVIQMQSVSQCFVFSLHPSVFPALCCTLIVCMFMLMNRYALTAWQPSSERASLSDHGLTDWWGGEQQTGKWEPRKEEEEVRRKRRGEGEVDKRIWEGWIKMARKIGRVTKKKKKKTGCGCAWNVEMKQGWRGDQIAGIKVGGSVVAPLLKGSKKGNCSLIASVGVCVCVACVHKRELV